MGNLENNKNSGMDKIMTERISSILSSLEKLDRQFSEEEIDEITYDTKHGELADQLQVIYNRYQHLKPEN